MSKSSERLMASSVGAAFAESVTLPTDIAKVRLQLQKSGGSGKVYSGMVGCVVDIARTEGPNALFKGLNAALIRQVSYTGLSFVLYEPVRDAIIPKDSSPSFAHRLLAGGTAGGIGIAIMNPAEVVKTQIQSNRETTLTIGQVAKSVYKSEGILGFWAGVQPNVARTFLVCAAELGTYDQAKTTLISGGWLRDGPAAHITASGIAGLASAATSTPADVVKTRLMNQAGGSHEYKGIGDALSSIIRSEGPLALYKGFVPVFWRKLIWCSCFFFTYEQLRVAIQKSRGEAIS